MSSPVDIARAAWGEQIPDWVLRLARECSETTQRAVGEKLGRSGSLVSQVLRKRYTGNMAGIEDAVRGAFMNATVECPALGTLPTDECQSWRRKAKIGTRTNALRVRMITACQTCPRNRKEETR